MLGKQKGVVLAAQQVSFDGIPFWDITYATESDPNSPRHARVGTESVYDNPAAGDKVTLQELLGVLTKIDKIEE